MLDETVLAHLSDRDLDDFLSRSTPAARLIEIDRHLAGCGDCRTRLSSRAAIDSSYRWMRREMQAELPEQHLEYEAVAALAEGRDLPDAAAHILRCPACRAEVEDLSSFVRARKAQQPPAVPRPGAKARDSRVHWLVAAAAAVVAVTGAAVWELENKPSEGAIRDAGGFVSIRDNGELRSPIALPPAFAAQVTTALRSGMLAGDPTIAGLPRGPELLLGAAPAPAASNFELLSPIGEAMLSDRPIFSWRELAGASTYRVNVYDQTYRKIAESPEVVTTTWTPVDSLPRGSALTWTVTAKLGSRTARAPVPPAPEAKFVVLGHDAYASLVQARQRYSGAHLLLASLYARAGVWTEARRELRALAAANPGSPLPAQLESSLPR